jgi:hypothetical protein
MRHMAACSGVLMAMALMVGCEDGADPVTAGGPSGFEVKEHTERVLEVAYDDGVVQLRLRSEEQAGVGVVEVHLGDLVLGVDLDHDRGTATTWGPREAIGQEMLDALAVVETALNTLWPETVAPTRTEQALLGAIAMISEMAPGVPWTPISVVNDRGWVNISNGDYCRSLWNSNGSYWDWRHTGKRSYNCKGACGAGCNYLRAWTMDCAEHDYGIGPFGDAVDDFSFAPLYWSEWGPAYCPSNCSNCKT